MLSCNRNFYFDVVVRCGRSLGHILWNFRSLLLSLFRCNFSRKLLFSEWKNFCGPIFSGRQMIPTRKWSRPVNDPQIGLQVIREPETIPTNDSAKKRKEKYYGFIHYIILGEGKTSASRIKSNNKKEKLTAQITKLSSVVWTWFLSFRKRTEKNKHESLKMPLLFNKLGP